MTSCADTAIQYSPCLVGTTVEFTWGAGEAVVLPYLKWLGVPTRFLGFAFLLNPLVVVFLQPVLGQWSDAYNPGAVLGKRIPFLLVLALFIACGYMLIVNSLWLSSAMLSLFGARAGSEASSAYDVAIGLCFFGMFVGDICNDLLLIPGRAYANDNVSSHTERTLINATFTMMQMLGKWTVMLIGMLPVERFFHFTDVVPGPANSLANACAETLVCSKMKAMLSISVFLMLAVCATVAVLYVVGRRRQRTAEYASLVRGGLSSAKSIDGANGNCTNYGSVKSEDGSTILEDGPTNHGDGSSLAPEQVDEATTPKSSAIQFVLQKKYLITVICAQTFGWITVMYQVFFWTVFVTGTVTTGDGTEVNISFIGLAVQATVSLVTSIVLPQLNARFEAVNVYFVGEMMMMCSFILLFFIGNGPGSIAVAFFLGIPYAVHANNAFPVTYTLIRKKEPDFSLEDNEAFIVAIINSTMPIGQILVGGLTGFIVEYVFHDDASLMFLSMGIIGLVLDLYLLWTIKRIG